MINCYEAYTKTISIPCIRSYISPIGMGEPRWQILYADDMSKLLIEGPFYSEETAKFRLKEVLKLNHD